MMNHTKPKNKNPKNQLQSLKKNGFVKIFLFLIFIVILIYIDADPLEVWNDVFVPSIEWTIMVAENISRFFFDLFAWLIDKAKDLLGI